MLLSRGACGKDSLSREPALRELFGPIEKRPQMTVLDVGCGSGDFTSTLHEKLEAKKAIGLESSPRMLAASRLKTAARLEFEAGNINNVD